MYNSPIKIYEKIMQEEMQEIEDKVVATVKSLIDVDVDKDELITALSYDRHQYEKGYKEGVEAERKRWNDNLVWLINHPTTEVSDGYTREN